MSAAEGSIAVELVADGGRVSAVRLRSTRDVRVDGAVRGEDPGDAARLVRGLFATCGTAHGAAFASALERAAGVEPVAAVARELLVGAERALSHGWSLLVEWPALAHRPIDVLAVRALRASVGAAAEAFDEGGGALAPGGAARPATPDAVERALAGLDAVVDALVGPLPVDADGLVGWSRAGASPAARAVADVLAAGAASFGASDVAPLPVLAADWYGARLASDPAFCARPTLDGAVHEAGPLARLAASPLTAQAIERHGRGVLARSVARIEELAALPAHLRLLASELRANSPVHLGRVTGAGCGVADTARGRLAHWVRVEDGVVADLRIVAPTEWTFHPDGALSRGLLGVPVADARRFGPLHVAALDPCVPCVLHAEGR